MVASSRSKYPHGLRVAVTVAFIVSLTFLPLISDGFTISGQNYGDYDDQSLVQRKMVLGSKPPACINKCLSCRPCVATLVIPSHQRKVYRASSSSSHGEDDNYYLLSWKCRCGNKLFQP
ncbi:EPIDERMAL PATTERNING FACTOR-like protein [Melia azedarach]|uniref:EPIDERMAL PATTERNING FACTOR-like protein n=1 Tax=Melia azedarach TaxID=155640 RepID=A0ACC1Y597_MELAZ|nr:EPIDERMAL PATTERNING FACTOR-like protein [Melia azedarach]